jgi:hypothetical protein
MFNWSTPHHTHSKHAIFTISLKNEVSMKAVQAFIGTARASGYDGDIVLATPSLTHSSIKKYLQKKRVTVYGINVKCYDKNPKELCSLSNEVTSLLTHSLTRTVPIAMIRFYIYQWWALQYHSDTVIMLSDFRDVFFQANPFAYKYYECKYCATHSLTHSLVHLLTHSLVHLLTH